ncbi:MAG TPA: ABC transporter ATP-binding protein, partial [Puia sp.]|nr:ABC transporter ATP-binding protein [Puia sp.]
MLKLVRKITAVLTPAEKSRLLLLTVLDMVSSMADIAGLALLLFVIRLYAEGPVRGGLSFLPPGLIDPHSLWPIGLFFLLFSIKNWLSFLIYSAQSRLRYGVASRISRQNLLYYLEGDYSQFAHTDSATHVLKIAQQPIEFSQLVLGGLQQGITEATLIGITVIAVLLFNAKLFLLLLLLLLPPVVITGYLAKRKLHTARVFIKTSRDIMWQHLQESIASYVESNLYNKKEFFSGRYGDAQGILNGHLATVQSMQGAPSRLAEIFAVFGLLALIAIGHFSGNPHGAEFVTLGAFLAAAYKIIPGISRLLNLTGQMKTYEFTVNGLLERGVGLREGEVVAPEPATGIHSISCHRIGFHYGQQKILDELSLQVRRGDFLGIQGHSGKGKTTLFNILLGFVGEETGEVRINGTLADRPGRKAYWKNIAYVKQQPFILHDTILVNITLQDHGYDEERLRNAVALSGLDELIKKLPGGLNARVTENGKNISGGQRQRIAIARALYKQADLILLDEPFSELDEASEDRLLRRFGQLAAEGKLVIMITHNMQSLSYCSNTI